MPFRYTTDYVWMRSENFRSNVQLGLKRTSRTQRRVRLANIPTSETKSQVWVWSRSPITTDMLLQREEQFLLNSTRDLLRQDARAALSKLKSGWRRDKKVRSSCSYCPNGDQEPGTAQGRTGSHLWAPGGSGWEVPEDPLLKYTNSSLVEV